VHARTRLLVAFFCSEPRRTCLLGNEMRIGDMDSGTIEAADEIDTSTSYAANLE
jgi:hypothetical protein